MNNDANHNIIIYNHIIDNHIIDNTKLTLMKTVHSDDLKCSNLLILNGVMSCDRRRLSANSVSSCPTTGANLNP